MSSADGSAPLGMIIYSAVKPIFKIYFIIALGFYLARRNILTVTTCRDISDCIVTAIMPCLIFNNVVTNLKSSDIKNLGIIFFTGTLLFVLGVGLSLLNKVVTKAPKRWFGGLLSVGLFPNISDLPIAYLQTLSKGGSILSLEEGDKGVAYVCIFLASQVFYQFSLGLYRLIEWDFREELLQDENEEKAIETPVNKSEMASNVPRSENHDIDNTSISSSISSNSSQMNDKEIDNNTRQNHRRNLRHSDQSKDDLNYQHNEFLRQHELHALHSAKSISSGSIIPTRTRSRRGSNGQTSISTNFYSLHLVPSSDLRRQKSENISDVINEYSEYEGWKNQEIKRISSKSSHTSHPLETGSIGSMSVQPSKKAKYRHIFIQMLKNFAAPNSVSLIVSIIIAMSPPLKALFVKSSFYIPNAPDNQPPLSFIIDIASYVGAASVPLGLLLLGATISRLRIKLMPKGFWKTAVAVTVSRLIILPIIGVGLTTAFYKGGWYGDDKLIRFVSVLEFGLPSATALVYFTAFYTDPTSDNHLQMDCLAVCLIFQYSILFITLPFLVSFTLKVSLGY